MALPDDDKMHNFIKKGESMGTYLRLLFKSLVLVLFCFRILARALAYCSVHFVGTSRRRFRALDRPLAIPGMHQIRAHRLALFPCICCERLVWPTHSRAARRAMAVTKNIPGTSSPRATAQRLFWRGTTSTFIYIPAICRMPHVPCHLSLVPCFAVMIEPDQYSCFALLGFVFARRRA